jgi:hypothetical protein
MRLDMLEDNINNLDLRDIPQKKGSRLSRNQISEGEEETGNKINSNIAM